LLELGLDAPSNLSSLQEEHLSKLLEKRSKEAELIPVKSQKDLLFNKYLTANSSGKKN
jgi:hypothetical protein